MMTILDYVEAFGTSEGVTKAWESRGRGSLGETFRDKWEKFLTKQKNLEDRADSIPGWPPKGAKPTMRIGGDD